MNAAEVAAALTLRWPTDRHLHIRECPLHVTRMGTKIDVAIFALWASLGYRVDAIEVKVSWGDFLKEVERRHWQVVDAEGRVIWDHIATRAHAENMITWTVREGPVEPLRVERAIVPDLSKSATWRAYAHRFWIAAPSKLAVKIASSGRLPLGWGLLDVNERRCNVIAAPTLKRNPNTFTTAQMLGMLREAADAGLVVRDLQRHAGYREGLAEGWRRSGLHGPPPPR